MVKTILKFDTGKKGFEKATYFLLVLAAALAVFAIVWFYEFLK
ncbi:MAG: hypothetical protein V3U24_06730 [Candidatus Neomarinimicrobiota bacterium]